MMFILIFDEPPVDPESDDMAVQDDSAADDAPWDEADSDIPF